MSKKIGYKSGELISLQSIAGELIEQENYTDALKYYNRVESIASKLGQKSVLARNYKNKGILYEIIESYDKALIDFKKSLELFEILNHTEYILTIYFDIGRIYFKLRKNEERIQYLQKGLDLAIENGDKKFIKMFTNVLN